MTLFQPLGRAMRPGDKLNLQCQACGHGAELDREGALARFGPGATTSDVVQRGKCTGCGRRGHVRAWI